jgi:hypothetical protein
VQFQALLLPLRLAIASATLRRSSPLSLRHESTRQSQAASSYSQVAPEHELIFQRRVVIGALLAWLPVRHRPSSKPARLR